MIEENLTSSSEKQLPAAITRELLHSLIMQAPPLVAVLHGPEFIVELANPTFCRVMGVNEEQQVLGRPLTDIMPEVKRQVFLSLLQGVYETGEPYHGNDMPAYFHRDGRIETLFFDFVYTPYRNSAGQIEAIFVIASDVTAQALAREQLDALREAAENANRAKDEFLAILGHELRNPLSPIVTALHLMKLRPDDSEHARIVIERQVNHLVRLVDDLLDVSRIARGKVDLKKQTLEISDVIAKAVEMVSPIVQEREHSLTVDVSKTGLQVNVDPTRLSQVVSNLLTNAAKYTANGGQILIKAEVDGDDVLMSVRDTGIGISPDVLHHIFDLFVQDKKAVDRAHGGMGLGLTIVRNLIHLHGGSVSAKSEGPGMGSEFLVRLPHIQS